MLAQKDFLEFCVLRALNITREDVMIVSRSKDEMQARGSRPGMMPSKMHLSWAMGNVRIG